MAIRVIEIWAARLECGGGCVCKLATLVVASCSDAIDKTPRAFKMLHVSQAVNGVEGHRVPRMRPRSR